MKKIIIPALVLGICFFACRKPITPTDTATITSQNVLDNFAESVAYANYADMEKKAAELLFAIKALDSNTNSANLSASRNAWKALRESWEQAEGFLFGPVEDNDIDPTIDTWPINKNDIDSLLKSGSGLSFSDIKKLPTSLRGFHTMEYIIFGISGEKTPAQFTPSEKKYIVSLSTDLHEKTVELKNEWVINNPTNFRADFTKSGNGGKRYTTRKDALITLVNAMAGICEEVGGGKMNDPLTAMDSSLQESQFAKNSTSDFRNNIIGVRNVYTSSFGAKTNGLDKWVGSVNISLNNKILNKINTAIASFDNIDINYGKAIYNQQVQINASIGALNELKEVLENDLVTCIRQNVKD